MRETWQRMHVGFYRIVGGAETNVLLFCSGADCYIYITNREQVITYGVRPLPPVCSLLKDMRFLDFQAISWPLIVRLINNESINELVD